MGTQQNKLVAICDRFPELPLEGIVLLKLVDVMGVK